MKDHPIQLLTLQIKELHINVLNPAESHNEPKVKIKYQVGEHQFNENDNTLITGMRCFVDEETDNDGNPPPFTIMAEIIGVFSVGDEFPKEHLEHFAQNNIPFILMPYLRENIYALASRTGINLLLPLVQLPMPKNI